MVNTRTDEHDVAFRQAMGADLRQLREACGLSIRQVAEDRLGWLFGNLDWLSKGERGVNSIDFIKWCMLAWFYRKKADGGHPGVEAAKRFLTAQLKHDIGFA